MCLVGEGSFRGPWCLHEILEKANAKVSHILLCIFTSVVVSELPFINSLMQEGRSAYARRQ